MSRLRVDRRRRRAELRRRRLNRRRRRAGRPAEAVPVVLTDRFSPWPRKLTFRVVAYGLLALGTVLYLGPFLVQLATSFKTDAGATANRCR